MYVCQPQLHPWSRCQSAGQQQRTWWPEDSRKAPMDAAMPMQTELTSGLMCLIVSNTAIPATSSSNISAWHPHRRNPS